MFTLLADAIAEGTEAFQASVTPEDTREIVDGVVDQFPTFLNPELLESQVFITIIDDDVPGIMSSMYSICKVTFHNGCISHTNALTCVKLHTLLHTELSMCHAQSLKQMVKFLRAAVLNTNGTIINESKLFTIDAQRDRQYGS